MRRQIRAAICHGHGQPFEIASAHLDTPRDDEVVVRLVAAGICHTDLAVRDRQLPMPIPAVLGHEGAGVVEQVGAAVKNVGPGDAVIMTFNSCGTCPSCQHDHPTYCYDFGVHNFVGTRPDGSHTIHCGETPIHAQFFGQSAFATHALAHARNVVRIPAKAQSLPLERLAPLGCGIMTGAGAILRSMAVRPDMPIAIFGAGAVGLAAVMAARIAGASPIIAVDLHANRRALALDLGATHAFDGKGDVFAEIRAACPAGLAYAFDTTGVAALIEGAFDLLAPFGCLGIVGASDPAAMLSFNEAAFMGGGRTVKGILGGDSDIQTFLPELIELHLNGHFPFERMIEFFPFDAINEAIAASENGRVIKPVLRIG